MFPFIAPVRLDYRRLSCICIKGNHFGKLRRHTFALLILQQLPFQFFFQLFCFFVFSDKTITATLVIQSACPVAINTVFCCALYGLKTDTAMAAFVSTTIVFLAVLCPIFFWLYL